MKRRTFPIAALLVGAVTFAISALLLHRMAELSTVISCLTGLVVGAIVTVFLWPKRGMDKSAKVIKEANARTQSQKTERTSGGSSTTNASNRHADDWATNPANPMNPLSPLYPMNTGISDAPKVEDNDLWNTHHSHTDHSVPQPDTFQHHTPQQDYTPPQQDYTPPQQDYTPSSDTSNFDSGSISVD